MTELTNMLKTKGYIFDYGGTLDTGGCHWGKVLWHTYQQAGVPVTEARFRDAYVHGERTLAKNPIIQPDYTFRQTLASKLHIEMEYLDCLNYHDQVLDLLYTEVCVRKPDPRIFQLGVEALGMKADEVTVVGDSIDKDIIPAHRAGCNTVWIRGEQWTDDPVDESQANLAIDNLTELLDNNNIKYIY